MLPTQSDKEPFLNQSIKDFTWRVIFDVETSEKFHEKINSYVEELPFFIPLFLNPNNSLKELKDFIYNRLAPTDTHLITTRVDNDDSVHKDFILETQKIFNHQNDLFIRFCYGYQWIIAKSILLKYFEVDSNHFITRIEKIENGFDTVVFGDGMKIAELKHVEILNIQNSNKKLWIDRKSTRLNSSH